MVSLGIKQPLALSRASLGCRLRLGWLRRGFPVVPLAARAGFGMLLARFPLVAANLTLFVRVCHNIIIATSLNHVNTVTNKSGLWPGEAITRKGGGRCRAVAAQGDCYTSIPSPMARRLSVVRS